MLADAEALRNLCQEQEERLKVALTAQASALQSAHKDLDKLMLDRAEAAKSLRAETARALEITELVERFTLLDRHYDTDLQRLRAIHETGLLFAHLDATQCPLCGALPGDQHLDTECDRSTEAIVIASDAEIQKIVRLRRELSETLVSLRNEYAELNAAMPDAQRNYERTKSQLNEIVTPTILEERSAYNELMSKMADVRRALEKIDRMKKLIQRRRDLADEDDGPTSSTQGPKTQISKSVLDDFAQEVQQILEDWDYPDASRVFFDEGKRDIQISGKDRGSTGKGLRAITHAAFTIGLMQFCRDRDLPHPGFIVLDSPLLAYWKPEGKDDDLRGTSLKEKFYRHLLGMSKDSQIIIVENEHPPAFVEKEAPVTVFTKNPSSGRYGFFPHE